MPLAAAGVVDCGGSPRRAYAPGAIPLAAAVVACCADSWCRPLASRAGFAYTLDGFAPGCLIWPESATGGRVFGPGIGEYARCAPGACTPLYALGGTLDLLGGTGTLFTVLMGDLSELRAYSTRVGDTAAELLARRGTVIVGALGNEVMFVWYTFCVGGLPFGTGEATRLWNIGDDIPLSGKRGIGDPIGLPRAGGGAVTRGCRG